MKKAFISLFAGLLMFGFASGAKATNLNIIAFDHWSPLYTDCYSYPESKWSYGGNDIQAWYNPNWLQYALIQFQIPTLSNIKIDSVKLSAGTPMYQGNPTIHYVENDIKPPHGFLLESPIIGNLISGELYETYDNLGHNIAWNIDFNNIPEFNNGNNILTVAMTVEPGAYGMMLYKNGSFGNEYLGPTLDISYSSAPVPEPSSIILGLMSLGGMLGLRKRTRKIEA